MSYGFELRNNDGEIVIDGSSPCAFLHDKGSKWVTNPSRWAGGEPTTRSTNHGMWREPDLVQFSSPVTTMEPPFILAHAGSTPLCMGPIIGRPGNWTGFLCYSPWWPRWVGWPMNISFAVHYAVFSRQGSVMDSSAFGMQVFAEDGKQVFDSRKFPFILQGDFQYQRFGQSQGTRVQDGYNGYATAARRLINDGVVINTPSGNHWPLLTGLNQMLYLSGEPIHPSDYAGGEWRSFIKLCVIRETDTRWRFVFRTILSGATFTREPYVALPSYDKVPNFGGGLGATNLLLFGQVPP